MSEYTNSPYFISSKALSLEQVVGHVVHPRAGAVNTFIGTVREWTGERKTVYLKYEAYESMAQKSLAQIGVEISERWPGVRSAIHHRIGELQISDIAVIIAVSAPHRADSFEACRYAIERLKQIVPIWKKEIWEDGQSWVGNQTQTRAYPSGQPEGSE